MTSTKSFSTKNAGILIVAIFSIAISIGLSQVTSAVAQTNLVDCSAEVDDESIDNKINDATSCVDEDEESGNSDNSSGDNQVAAVSSSTNNDDDEEGEESDISDSVKTPSQSFVSTAPASADPEDNVIKPINLNKGFNSDKPLKTNNDMNTHQDEDAEAMKVIEDNFEFNQQLDKTSSVSEIYESFDLPYTALYKNP